MTNVVNLPNPLGAALAVLFLNFPSGVTEAIKKTDLFELTRLGISPEVVTEAAQRILHTREQRTVPPLAVILKTCREVQHERVQQDSSAKTYTLEDARDLAERRLKRINETSWRKIPLTDENVDLHVAQMQRCGVIEVAAQSAGED